MKNAIPKIFVIVVTYKGKQWYDRCFTSLRNSTIPVQTIVVDNASNDGTVEYIKENYPEILLIESKENLGFGKGNNLALKYAYGHECDYVFLLNQDAWLDKDDTLEQLVEVAKKHPEYAIVSPMHLAADKNYICMAIGLKSNNCLRRLLSDMYCRGQLDEIYETDYINAAGWLLPRRTLDMLGGFDPLIFHYGEDDDYQNRVHFHGLKIGICPNITMIHDHQSDSIEFCRKLLVQANRNGLAELLNLNIKFDYYALRMLYLKMYFKAVMKRDSKLKDYAMYRYKYIKEMRKKIEYSRKQNSIKQPNWIV